MNRSLLSVAVAALAVSGVWGAKKAKTADPVIMTVNGKDVPLSEFEFLYNKNNDQQLERQTPEQYLEMFINYKLKVADAEAHGIDTTRAFLDELDQHRRELAKPYMIDTAAREALVRQIYDHGDRILDVSHIMLAKARTRAGNDSVKARLDSLRTAIISGVADFGDVAVAESIDPQAPRNRGHMGRMGANMYPYTFENVAYETPVGEISQVMETPFGFHIIKVNEVTPNPGKVSVSHILKLTRNMPDSVAELTRLRMDSIYALVKDGSQERFAEVAKAESQDPGSASKGGQLPWFGAGEMVPEFESTAFTLADGEVSKPFKTAYGYHIIMRHQGREREPYEEMREEILRNIQRDDRRDVAANALLDKVIASHKGGLDKKGLATVEKTLSRFAEPDSAALSELRAMSKTVVATITDASGKKETISAAEVAAGMIDVPGDSKSEWMNDFRQRTLKMLRAKAEEVAMEELPAKYPAYRNLYNEYRDGILLFDISNTNVWDRALKDTEGLENYFRANRAHYTWDKPRYKGYVVFATSDSIKDAAQAFVNEAKLPADSLANALKEKFGRDVKVERVLAAQGDNAIIDFIAFSGPQPDLSKNRWVAFFPVEGRIIDAPEEARDVRGAVGADYQQELEQQWVKQLREKYPVTVDRKVFEQVK